MNTTPKIEIDVHLYLQHTSENEYATYTTMSVEMRERQWVLRRRRSNTNELKYATYLLVSIYRR